jgi:D-amino-acid oxidase
MDDVVVVGAGVIGLSCAIRLQQAGAEVQVISPDRPERTTSWISAAVWYPTHTDADPRVLAWAAATFEEFARQAHQGVPGVTMRPTRMLLRGPTAAPWWSVAVPDFRIVAPQPGSPYTGEWHFTVPAVEMAPYLDWQIGQLIAAGGVLRRRNLDRLDEATALVPGAGVIVNATGLGARHLADDAAVHPIRGRIVIVTNPGITTSVRDEDHPDGTTYVHPRSQDVVLGGSFEPGRTDLTPDPAATRAILARCRALVPALTAAEVITPLAGLRPGRHGGVRLEAGPGAGGARLIHNYGHGGAGMTLSWGCADAVAALAAAP